MRTKYRFIAFLCVFLMLCSVLSSCMEIASELPIPKKLKWSVGGALPTANDFFDHLPEGARVRFEQQYDFTKLGNNRVNLIYTAPNGKESIIAAEFTLAIDETPPEILGVHDISVCLGEGISYRSGVSVRDDFDGKVTLSVDSSAVIATKEGNYRVTYTARDNAGNETSVQATVWIYREAVTKEMLWEMIDILITQHNINYSSSKERQARAVFEYVYYNIRYDAYSDKNDWVRAAYEGIKSGKGDCFTYFALSKAFFERLGIENMDVTRTPGIVDERHYWNLVNIGTKESPLWYHFDACQMSGISFKGCLLTDAQVEQYTVSRVNEQGIGNYFYVFNEQAFPARATKAITDPYDYLS